MYEIIIGRKEAEREKFGTEGAVFLGKQYVRMGQTTSISNNVYMDVTRSHVVFISGKRGSGKCLHGDTLVTLANGLRVPIRDIEKYNANILALDNEFRIIRAEKKGLYKRNVKYLLHINLRSGNDIMLTPEHPLLTMNGWLPAVKLDVGDKIAAPTPEAAYRATRNNIGNNNNTNNISCNPETVKTYGLVLVSDIFWDEIISIEKLHGDFIVYDITVPEMHNFVANNIIVHNSYTMGAIAEGIHDLPEAIRSNISIIMLDTMGVYWTMKYPNKKDQELLEEWGLEPRAVDVKIFTPEGFFNEYKEKGIPTDFPFSIKPADIDPAEWLMILGIEPNEAVAVLIERVITELKESSKDFSIKEIVQAIHKDDRTTRELKDAAENKFLLAEKWGLFSRQGTLIENLVIPGQITVLDVSCYATMSGAASLRALVIGLVAEKLFLQRMTARKAEELESVSEAMHFFEEEEHKMKEPLVWLIIDEAHEFLKRDGVTPASAPLKTILREGRQPGISLILATQQPGKIHTDVITQSDIVISHRLTANIDVKALSMLAQSYMRENIDKHINLLPREPGSAVVFDDTNERVFPIKVRPRYSWHGGESPIAMHPKKKIFEF